MELMDDAALRCGRRCDRAERGEECASLLVSDESSAMGVRASRVTSWISLCRTLGFGDWLGLSLGYGEASGGVGRS